MVEQVQQEVVVSNSEGLEKVKQKIKEAGADKFHVVADFDRTVTYGLTEEGGRTHTVIYQLRSDVNYLGEDYVKEASRLFDIYRPKEIDPSLSLEEKKKEMHDWWKLHFNLIAKSGFSKKLAEKVVRERPLKFRKGFKEFMEFLNEKNIPIVFMSATPGDMLVEYLKKEGLDFESVYILSNRFEFDKEGSAVSVREPLIHTFNKTEFSLHDSEAYEVIKSRPNILLLGDSEGDSGMAEGSNYENLIKIGFLNEKIDESLELYKSNFDVVLTGDQDFDYVNELMKEMLG